MKYNPVCIAISLSFEFPSTVTARGTMYIEHLGNGSERRSKDIWIGSLICLKPSQCLSVIELGIDTGWVNSCII